MSTSSQTPDHEQEIRAVMGPADGQQKMRLLANLMAHTEPIPAREQGEDDMCGDQFDDMFCDRDPGHDGHHGYDTTAWEWDSTETPKGGAR